MVELLDKRTLTQKRYALENGVYRLDAHIGHIHYQDGADKDGAFQDCDTTLEYNNASQTFGMTKASYEAELGLYGDVHFHNVDSQLALTLDNPAKVEGVPYLDSPFGKLGKAIIWKDIIQPGGHQIVEARNGSLAKIFHFDSAPKSLTIDFAVDVQAMDFNALEKPTTEKSLSLTTARHLVLTSAKKTTYIRKAHAWNHRGAIIDIPLDFYLDKDGKLRAVKTLPQAFVDKTFTDEGAWLECDTTESYYAGAGDGHIQAWGSPWSSVRGATDGGGVSATSANCYPSAIWDGSEYDMKRAFFPVDTGGLPDGAVISAASLYLTRWYGSTSNHGIIQTSQADPTTLTTADFDALTLNSPTEGASRIAYDDMTFEVPYEIVLNASGRGWINKSGYSLFGVREADKDIDNNAPADTTHAMYIYCSEASGTSFDPYLSVTYTSVQTARPSSDISDGSWRNESDSALNLYASIDETSASDADHIKSGISPSSDVCEVALSSVSDPLSSSNHKVRYRYKKNPGTETINLTIALVQGTTVIASTVLTDISDTFTDGEFTLSSGEADSITNYADLRLRFTANKA